MNRQLYANVEDRRDKIQIFYDIIKVSEKPTKITKILRLANVQYNTFQECIERLIKTGLLEKVYLLEKGTRSSGDKRNKISYKATAPGLQWCKNVEEIYLTLES